MFINRETELSSLNQKWQNQKTNFFIIYGRRRVGKTELIKQFLMNKPGLYFLTDRLPERENLRSLSRIVRDTFEDEFLGDFTDWDTFFRYLKRRIQEKTVLIIDEFPYLVETNPALSSVFQRGWDEYLKDTPIFLILCGSSMAMMYRETLAYKAPLFGRRTGQLLIKPMKFQVYRQFFPGLDFETILAFFSITGGIPAYARQMDAQLSIEENIVRNVLDPACYLYQEVNFLLKEEVREPRIYFSILKSIALGKRKFGEIVNETGVKKTSLHKYLFTLEELNFIEKEYPVTERNVVKSRRGLYRLTDNFFRFWFNFVFAFHSELELGNIRPSQAKIDQMFVHLVAATYEEVACEFIKEYQSNLFNFFRMGRWWDRQHEIDLLAFDESNENILFAEVKWSAKPVGTNIFFALREKAEYVDWPYKKAHYALFSRSGFTTEMQQLAQQEQVWLFHHDHLMEWKGCG